jgi:hypothetical protein
MEERISSSKYGFGGFLESRRDIGEGGELPGASMADTHGASPFLFLRFCIVSEETDQRE